jgi:hypothetical protein
MIKQAKWILGIPYQELKIQRLLLGIVSVFFRYMSYALTDFKRAAHWIRSNEEPTDLGELNKRWYLYLVLSMSYLHVLMLVLIYQSSNPLDIVESYIP